MQVTDDVLAQARAGDVRARASIYALLAPATFALIRRLSGNRAQAEDLFQDTMMTVYLRLADYRGEAPLGAWVRQIAVTKCLMYLRSPWHRARLGFDRTADEDPSCELHAAATPAFLPESVDVERALASLAPVARAVVCLSDVEGYSHQEIAREFGRSLSFSKSQLARAHARLREWFEPDVDRQSCLLS